MSNPWFTCTACPLVLPKAGRKTSSVDSRTPIRETRILMHRSYDQWSYNTLTNWRMQSFAFPQSTRIVGIQHYLLVFWWLRVRSNRSCLLAMQNKSRRNRVHILLDYWCISHQGFCSLVGIYSFVLIHRSFFECFPEQVLDTMIISHVRAATTQM